VAWYRFDETKGDVAVDSSGKGRNGTIVPVTNDWTLVQDGGGRWPRRWTAARG
jgi:hypothetical protein